jgi:protease PrsW
MSFCIHCGAPVPAQSAFCSHCGAPVALAPPKPPSPVTNQFPQQPFPAPPPGAYRSPYWYELPPGAEPRPAAPPPPNVVKVMMERLHRLASTEKLEGFSLSDMFSEVFKKRTEEEIDDYFIGGTSRTTLSIDAVETGWPKPWFFARILMFTTLLYLGFTFALGNFLNTKLLPGMIFTGSVAVPLATLFLFYELNTPRNVPVHRVLYIAGLGGVVSIFISLLGFQVSGLSTWIGPPSAGIVEETGKLLTVVAIARGRRFPFILNGMLAGAAVGTGFAAFESAGYALDALLRYKTIDAMMQVIHLRALLSPFIHIPFTAIAAGALWRAKGSQSLSLHHFFDASFLKAFAIPVVLHMIWNTPVDLPFHLKHLTIGVIAWFVVFGLVQQGLKQVKQQQIESVKTKLEESGANLRTMNLGA